MKLVFSLMCVAGIASGAWHIRSLAGPNSAWAVPWSSPGAGLGGDSRPAWGNTIYVSPNGSDANAGDSPQTPLRSIQTALGRANPGDIVAMLPGEYSEEVRLEKASGSAGSPVYLRAIGGSARLTGNRSLSGGLMLEGCRYITIEGIEVADFANFGIQVVDCEAITICNCDVHHNGLLVTNESEGGYGLYVNGSGHAILNNTVRTNGANPDVGDGLICWGTSNTVVRGNTCNYNKGNGILIEDSVGVLVEWNTVSYTECLSTDGTWWNAGLWLDGGHHVTVRNNSFTDNLGPGIEISDEETQAPYAYEVSGNDISSNEWGVYLWGFRHRAVEPIVISNNTLTGNSRAPLRIEDLAATPEELNIFVSTQMVVGAASAGPRIKANGLRTHLITDYPEAVTIAVEMNASTYAGKEVDWWVVARIQDSGEWFYLNSSLQWTPFSGALALLQPVYQGALFDLASRSILDNRVLPIGTYDVWFVIDYPMDGVLDLTGQYLADQITVEVQ